MPKENDTQNKSFKYNVKELVIDAHGCQRDLNRPDVAKRSVIVLRDAAKSVGATVCEVHFTPYTKHGFTAVALLAESHIILTTWPEYDYASINIYLCNQNMDHEIVREHLFDYIRPSTWRVSWFRHITLPDSCVRIFLAAPFSRYLSGKNFSSDAYDQIALLISTLRGHGYNVFSAHEREEYGHKLMSPEMCTRLDFEEMIQVDVVLAAISDHSYGVCVELGWASALNKPIILFNSSGSKYSSPLVEGIGEVTQVINVYQISEILDTLKDIKCAMPVRM